MRTAGIQVEPLERRISHEDMMANVTYNQPKLPPKANLATQMAALATDFNNEGFRQIREDITKKIRSEAALGKRSVYYYPKSNTNTYKDLVMSWLEQEGFIATWNHEQRDGIWVQIAW